MKKLAVQKLGLQELSKTEQVKTTGGAHYGEERFTWGLELIATRSHKAPHYFGAFGRR